MKSVFAANQGFNTSSRIKTLQLICIIVFSLLILRLWFLQGLYGSYYRDRSENNRIRTLRLRAPRGRIFDRYSRVLVRNRPSYSVGIMHEDAKDPATIIKDVATILNIPIEDLQQRYKDKSRSRRFEPRIILRDLSRSDFAKLKAISHRHPALVFDIIPERDYPQKEVAAHVLGHVKRLSPDELRSKSLRNYQLSDVIGKAGIEKKYEEILRGRAGVLQLEVDARGRRKQELKKLNFTAGRDITLTINSVVQKSAHDALGGFRGAVVAIDPRDGGIIALASNPSYDANIFSGLLKPDDWNKLNNDPDKPLSNRTIASVYPPGSTIKLLYGYAGLTSKIITPETSVFCPGFYTLGNRRFHCHKRSGHGYVNVHSAIIGSCNVFFYELGQKLGISKLHSYLDTFGFGKVTGLDIGGEKSGIAPSKSWKEKRFHQSWYPGDTIPVSIGQGYLSATPIQLAQLAMLIANGGVFHVPHLVHAIKNSTGEFETFNHSSKRISGFNKESLSIINKAANFVISHPRGTGKRAAIEGITIAGKTGTSQVISTKNASHDEKNRDHAWFIAYGPIENPNIALSVLVENSGHGGQYAAPVAKEVMTAYFLEEGLLQKKPETNEENDKE